MDKPIVLQLKGITKRFGTKVVANDHVDLDLRQGEILSILGENGSGKTTLMNMIIGIYRQDEGNIFINGEEVTILSPKDAYKYKIGMVHQHFKLVDVLQPRIISFSAKKSQRSQSKKRRSALEKVLKKQCRVCSLQSRRAYGSVVVFDCSEKQSDFQTAMKIAALPFIKAAKAIKFGWLAKIVARNCKNCRQIRL